MAEFCRMFNIHRNTLPRYESGERTPDADFIVSICNNYKINANWLILDKGPKHWVDTQKQEAQQIDMEALVDAIDTLEKILHDKQKTMEPAHKAEIIAKIYEYYLDEEPGKNKDKIYNLLKLVA